ncbi:hypothetical protein [Paracoccus salsus]|nr:hypothetical protein [Paracoccus salsus]
MDLYVTTARNIASREFLHQFAGLFATNSQNGRDICPLAQEGQT